MLVSSMSLIGRGSMIEEAVNFAQNLREFMWGSFALAAIVLALTVVYVAIADKGDGRRYPLLVYGIPFLLVAGAAVLMGAYASSAHGDVYEIVQDQIESEYDSVVAVDKNQGDFAWFGNLVDDSREARVEVTLAGDDEEHESGSYEYAVVYDQDQGSVSLEETENDPDAPDPSTLSY